MNRRTLLALTIAATASLAAGTAALASDYPSRPVTIIVSYPPGGDTDAMARVFAERLTQALGQPVVVENRPGAGGTIGNSFVGRADPDGYTLLFTPNPFTTAPMVMDLPADASYDVLEGFAPVIQTNLQSVVLVANAGTGITSVAEMVERARAGEELSYASPGAGSPMHIAAEWINHEAGIKIEHIPYRGVGPIIPDVLAGHVDLAYVTYGPVAQLIEKGDLNLLAITDAARNPVLANVPTVAEQGFDAVRLGAWHGIMAPRGTPAEVVARLNAEMNKVLTDPEVVALMASFGAVPVGGPPETLAATNAADFERLGKVVTELGVRSE
jgi:tripartite-type tricarboxylate transporter receptor subunit TctC